MPKFEVFHSVDSEGNSAVSLEDAETAHSACAEFKGGAVRTTCLAVTMDLPEDGADEDHVDVLDVQIPPLPELPEGGGEEAPPELPAEQPAEATSVAA